MDSTDLLQIKLTGQYDLREANVGEKLRLLHAADIALGAGVQLDGRNIQLQHAHILHDQRINASLVEVGDQAPGRLQLIIMQNGI